MRKQPSYSHKLQLHTLPKKSSSRFMRSAIIFAKLSQSVKLQTQPQINKALLDIYDQIQQQKTSQMKGNLKELTKLLTEKKNMIVKQKQSVKMQKRNILKMEVKINNEIKGSSCQVTRRDASQQSDTIFCDDQSIKCTSKLQRRSKPELIESKTNKYRMNRFSLNKQNIPQQDKSKILKQLVKSFCVNPATKHKYYNAKKDYRNSLLSSSNDYFKKLYQNTNDHHSRYQVKKVSQLDKHGIQIQNYLNQCNEVLEKHYISLDKIQEAQEIKNHRRCERRVRNTFGGEGIKGRQSNKLVGCQLRKIVNRKIKNQNCLMNSSFQ